MPVRNADAQWEGSLFLIAGRTGMILEGFQTNVVGAYLWVSRSRSIRNWLWELQRLRGKLRRNHG